jgi:hypothetical protein
VNNAKPDALRLLACRTLRRHGSTQVAAITFELLGLMVLPAEVHEKNGQYWIALPKGLKWSNQRINERARRALLTAIGAHDPGLFAKT